MKDYLSIIIVVVIASVVFALLWRQGAFLRLSGYFHETKDELVKCTWPTWDELTGSTVVVIMSVAILGGFTVGVDYVVTLVLHYIV
jgi:preprotein translocase subunit SecE